MSFTLKTRPDRGSAAAARRIALDQLAKVRQALAVAEDEPDRGIHEARKRLKRLRGLVRLIRRSLGKEAYHRENRAFRDAGRALAPLRDSAVRIRLVGSLRDDVSDDAKAALDPVIGKLRERHAALLSEEASKALAKARKKLEGAEERVADWPLDGDAGFELLRGGLLEVYARGRREMRKAFVDPSAENLHEWRKRAKYLRHQIDLLSPAWPEMMGLAEDSLHELTTLLGDDHDLAVVRETLQAELPAAAASNAALAEIQETLADRHQAKLEPARALGRRLFAEKPQDFVRRIESYWNSRSEAQAT